MDLEHEILDALQVEREGYYGNSRSKNIEERIEANSQTIARLISTLFEQKVLNKDEVLEIVDSSLIGWEEEEDKICEECTCSCGEYYVDIPGRGCRAIEGHQTGYEPLKCSMCKNIMREYDMFELRSMTFDRLCHLTDMDIPIRNVTDKEFLVQLVLNMQNNA